MEPDIDLRPELTCSICRMVLVAPLTHLACRHSFCGPCASALLSTAALEGKCPICRGDMDSTTLVEDRRLKEEVVQARVRCKCGEVLHYSAYNGHHDSCGAVQGTIQTAFERSKRACGNAPNRSTFPCPDCEAKNLDRESLISHVARDHPSLYTSCPICAAMPWGESDEDEGLTLGEHLAYRHRFDYDTFTVRGR